MNNEEMIHWWQGYVIVKVKGERLERLINRMMIQRLAAWNLVRTSKEDAQVSITLTDFFKLRMLLKETGCRVEVIERVGLPFILKKVKRRIGLYVGAGLFLIMLYVYSMMIWTVEIEGITLPEDEYHVRQTLEEMGVKPGALKFRLDDVNTIKRKVMEEIPTVTWVGFEYEGTKAKLTVVEKTMPEIPEKTNPRNLVSTKKAIVHDIFVEKGEAKVKPDQYVKPGDVLISGKLGTEDNPEIVSAKGKVLGEVWYVSEVSIPLERTQKLLSGEEKKQYYLNVGPFGIKVWGFGDIPFEQYIVTDNDYSFSIKNWTFPISWTVQQVAESNLVQKQLTEEEAEEMAIFYSRRNMEQQLVKEAEIKEEKILKKRIEHGKVYIKMHYSVIEEITNEQLLLQGE